MHEAADEHSATPSDRLQRADPADLSQLEFDALVWVSRHMASLSSETALTVDLEILYDALKRETDQRHPEFMPWAGLDGLRAKGILVHRDRADGGITCALLFPGHIEGEGQA
ncbi:MAG TPA: hypothetical protein VK741_23725 [Acetobacteraceae bacterium]|nr:hypothetical protein [Acetobacteraceae bacterium]